MVKNLGIPPSHSSHKTIVTRRLLFDFCSEDNRKISKTLQTKPNFETKTTDHRTPQWKAVNAECLKELSQ